MVAVDAILQMLIAVIIVSISFTGNSFIVHVYFLDYRRNKALKPNELIVTVLAFFNILIQFNLLLWFMVYLFNLCTFFGDVIYQVLDFSDIFLSESSYWFIAWLCFIYFVKIVKMKRKFFRSLKQKISLLVNILIFFSMLVNFFLALPVIYMIKLKANSTSLSMLCKDYYITGDTAYIYSAFLSFFTSFLPLVIMLMSSLGIVIFLCMHSRTMRKNTVAGNSSHGGAHTAVAMMIVCLIVLYMLCKITVLVANIQIAMAEFDISIAIFCASSIHSAGSSVILIIGTVKLRQSCGTLCCSQNVSDSNN
ncbi:taste receptor type 2 member 39-like [Latimeria chalumnae]|uniref:taste receptor type 2 member 39-like n=1 Tax=Latimeria chalumnae TaxID=7897 RepID=UPI0003C18BA2|nr:PREDICTED: taste receptor type 2 member 39-like [Latimeria chalumnae]|eukprot:XP_006007464.1 PREDICTED: taste receptor type 2 member 39-like [Latimeria chalumnae]